jgi:hypothetical protein
MESLCPVLRFLRFFAATSPDQNLNSYRQSKSRLGKNIREYGDRFKVLQPIFGPIFSV